jgi:hypothetical protein
MSQHLGEDSQVINVMDATAVHTMCMHQGQVQPGARFGEGFAWCIVTPRVSNPRDYVNHIFKRP